MMVDGGRVRVGGGHREREPIFTPLGTKKKAFIAGGVVGEEARVTGKVLIRKKRKRGSTLP